MPLFKRTLSEFIFRRFMLKHYASNLLVDMNLEETVLDENQETKCRWSPWHGETLTGKPVQTWVMGRRVFADGKIDADCRGAVPG